MISNPTENFPCYFKPYKRTTKDHLKMIVILAVWSFICHLIAFNINLENAKILAYILSLIPIAVYVIKIYEELPSTKLSDQQVVALLSSDDQKLTHTMKAILKEFGYIPRHYLVIIKFKIEAIQADISRLIIEKKLSNLDDSELLNLTHVLDDSTIIINTILKENSI